MLFAVVDTAMINQYGINKILEPFVDELMQLESVRLPFKYRRKNCMCQLERFN